MVHTCVFQESNKNLFFGKNARDKCCRSKYRQFPANFGQIVAFPHAGISLMTKDWAQIKVYTYFNIDAKTGKIEGKVE